MQITKQFLIKIFSATNMQRWNDLLRPIEFRELDKQSHKMIIAYVLGKYEEEKRSKGLDWIQIIEGGIFEFLQRLVVTDLKPEIFHEIIKDPEKNKALNTHVLKKLNGVLFPLGRDFNGRFKDYLFDPPSDMYRNINKKILHAAHFYASRWEFNIIERISPQGGYISKIRKELREEQEKNYDLEGIRRLSLYAKLYEFVDLCGQLRFQIRWSDLHRLPKTSVLGHMLLVAILSYLFSLQIGACRRRRFNNFFTGLFHDLPEVLTRDIKDPLKKSIKGFEGLLRKYEAREMKKRIYDLLPKLWFPEIKMFTRNVFKNCVVVNGKKQIVDEITKDYNKTKYDPRDGQIVLASDKLVAFIEAYMALKNGIVSQELEDAKNSLKQKYRGKSISGINFGHIYDQFD